jgi:hypothetical protein
MYLHGGKPLSKPIADKLKSTLLAHDLFDEVSGQTMDDFEQMAKVLLQHGEMDRTFTIALVKQALSICRPLKSDVFYALDGPVRSLITSLLASHPHEVWLEVSKLLTATDWQVRFYAEHLFEPDHDNHLGPGLLYGLPPDVYLDWVRKAPAKRAEIVMEWLPITTTGSDGKLAWHPDLQAYVKEFGNQPRALVGLARRLHPSMVWGSVAPHLEQFLPLLELWANTHKRAEVRHWAQEQIGYISAEIDAHRKRDEEHDVGIY